MDAPEVRAEIILQPECKTTFGLFDRNRVTREGVWHYRDHRGTFDDLKHLSHLTGAINHKNSDCSSKSDHREEAMFALRRTFREPHHILISIKKETGTFLVHHSRGSDEIEVERSNNELPALLIKRNDNQVHARYTIENGKASHAQIITPSGTHDFERKVNNSSASWQQVKFQGGLPSDWEQMPSFQYLKPTEGISLILIFLELTAHRKVFPEKFEQMQWQYCMPTVRKEGTLRHQPTGTEEEKAEKQELLRLLSLE
ncbi:MAG: hypothetical protein Q9162_000575 [Coniocarpon cinnabarinum]